MSTELDKYSKVFELLLEADKKLWEAVLEIREDNLDELEKHVKPLMELRGNIHVDFMRPMYKKYPILAEKAGFDNE